MINMENREITPESIIKNSEHDCTPTIILYKTQWHTVYDWMQEYSDQQNKQLLDEIELVNTMNVKLNNNNIKLLNEIDMLKELNATLQFHNIKYQSKIDQLQFELKAADSVNEQLQFQYNELEKAMYKLTISNDNN